MKLLNYSLTSCLLLAALFSLSGCVNLKPKPDLTKQYVLGESANNSGNTGTHGSASSIYIERPDLPSYLSTNRLVYRKSTGELTKLKHALWAEPLSEGLARTLAEYMTASSATVSGFYPWPNGQKKNKKVKVRFHRVSANEDGTFILVADWMIEGSSGSETRGHFSSGVLNWEVGQPASYIQAVNAGLKALSEEIQRKI